MWREFDLMEQTIMHFHTIEDLQTSLTKYLQELKAKSEEYSNVIGEKLRSENTTNDATEMAELKEKFEGFSDPKKKKPVKKKDQKTNWYEVGPISIYDGIGLKGELEIYFKTIDELKGKIEKIEKVKESVDGLISKGIKKGIGCVAILNHDLSLQISFIKAGEQKAKFSYKSIFTIPREEDSIAVILQ